MRGRGLPETDSDGWPHHGVTVGGGGLRQGEAASEAAKGEAKKAAQGAANKAAAVSRAGSDHGVVRSTAHYSRPRKQGRFGSCRFGSWSTAHCWRRWWRRRFCGGCGRGVALT